MIREDKRPLEDWTFAEMREALELALDLVERMRWMEADEWMDHSQAAEYLKTTPGTLYQLARSGEIPRHSLSEKKYVYSRREVDAFLMSR